MSGRNIIVIGASAGGVEALCALIQNLPSDLPAAIFVVLHVPAHSTSVLPSILNRTGALKAIHPQNGEAIAPGHIYIAPPDHHLLVKRDRIHLARGPRENNHRPAVDPLFRTAARAYGRRTIGIVLSGVLDDGTAGLIAIKMQGGIAIVQNPDEAMYSGMPRSAIENVEVDHILSVSDMAPLLVSLTGEQVEEKRVKSVSEDMEIESDIAELDMEALQSYDRPGTPSGFACPDCGGALWEIPEGHLPRFRCRVGHAFSANSLLAQQSDALEDAFWVALRALEESAALAHRLAERAQKNNHPLSSKRFAEQALGAKQRATIIREVLLNGNGSPVADPLLTEKEIEINELPAEETKPHISPPFPIIAIASSSGGLKALTQVLSGLPAEFPAAIVAVQHLDPRSISLMAEILDSRTQMPVKEAQEADLLQPGKVYIAPPNRHLLVNEDGTLSLSSSELVNYSRPSADLLFESVAASSRESAIAVVLTGKGKDGAMGARAIKQMRGRVIAQDAVTSEQFSMPKAAIDAGVVDLVLPLEAIAATLISEVIRLEQ